MLLERFGIYAVLVLASVLRFVNLDQPHRLVFDETWYVKDAITLDHFGYEAAWPNDPNPKVEAGNINIFTANSSFVVHPPLGKWIIGLGLQLFGNGSSFGWRFSTAVFGVLLVGLTYLIARQLFTSKLWSLTAAFFMAIDGHAIVLSRTGILDIFLATFVAAAFYALLRDRKRTRAELIRRARHLEFGVVDENHPGTGREFLHLGVVWRRVASQGLANLLLTAPLSLAVYLASYTGWFLTDGGWDRHWADQTGNAATGFWAWVPLPLQSLWHDHVEQYNFSINLHTPHSYQANPLTWLFALRPTAFWYTYCDTIKTDCATANQNVQAILPLGNPYLWFAAGFAAIYLLVRYIRTRDNIAGLILLGLGAGYLPWMLYLNRTVFQFYSIIFLPYTLLGLVYVLRLWLRSRKREQQAQTRIVLFIFIVIVAAISVFFLPLWVGTWIPYWYWKAHMWIPSWI